MENIETLPLAGTTVKDALGHKSKIIKGQILLNIKINEYTDDIVFLSVPKLAQDCILGIDLLKNTKCIINFDKDELVIGSKNKNVELLVLDVIQDENRKYV